MTHSVHSISSSAALPTLVFHPPERPVRRYTLRKRRRGRVSPETISSQKTRQTLKARERQRWKPERQGQGAARVRQQAADEASTNPGSSRSGSTERKSMFARSTRTLKQSRTHRVRLPMRWMRRSCFPLRNERGRERDRERHRDVARLQVSTDPSRTQRINPKERGSRTLRKVSAVA